MNRDCTYNPSIDWEISETQSVEELDKLFQNIISKLNDPANWGGITLEKRS